MIAKLAFDASDNGLLKTFVERHCSDSQYCAVVLWTLRCLFGLLAIISNAMMLKHYVASLKINGATKATVYTFSCNFILTVPNCTKTNIGYNGLPAIWRAFVSSLGSRGSHYDGWSDHAREKPCLALSPA